MMNKQKTSARSMFKYALCLPLIGALVLFNSTLPMRAGAAEMPVTVLGPEAVLMEDEPLIYDAVDVPPQFPGGEKGLMQWLSDNIKYPESAHANGVQGRVVVRFIVSDTGEVRDAELLLSLDPACDAEALRVVRNMPRWEPGKQDGRAVMVRYSVPIMFLMTANPAETRQPADASGSKEGQAPQAVGKALKFEADTENLPPAAKLDEAVYIVDGRVVSSEELSTIDPATIESINVYKNQSPTTVVLTLKK